MSRKKIIDPTANVIALVKAEKRRADDLRNSSQKLTERELFWSDKYNEMRFSYEERLVAKQSARHDANEETLKVLVKSVQDALTESTDRIVQRVSALELSQSQNQGKSSTWTNPILLIIISALVGFIIAKYLR